ncbi:hypothetical protein G8770_09910 [Aestuariicella hydrocarbonica]|uniref:Uncharacterized protein n=1 Tax=Pseudomaricurvus hydrocarbonicus TaxID=1470433 RepID=A0A9E5MHE9_9GAMM|nr:hypothetical protein [Aestuariicella hydrocarbonica]NHO65856.1 hypothetical protein [Aestuariicella hydrocarbonica]
MPTCVSKQTNCAPPTGTSRHPPLALLLVEVKQGLKKISDNPRAYRSKAFTEWYRQAQELYQSTAWFGAPPIIGERFSQRRFGRSRDLLNDIEIFVLFKLDVQVTMKELDYFMARYRHMEELAHSQQQHTANGAMQLPHGHRLISQGLLGLLTLGFLLWLLLKF